MPGIDIRIRNAAPTDAAVLADMIRQLAAHEGAAQAISFTIEQLADALQGDPPRLRAVMAEDAVGALGFVTYTIDLAVWTGGDVIRVDDVFVSDRARRRGIGRLMMTRIAELAIAGGMSARWEIEPENFAAQRFYQDLGVAIRNKIVARCDIGAMSALLGDSGTGRTNNDEHGGNVMDPGCESR